ncbi:hypothetical protein RRG08_039149 [Elysia crispata]|uniref:Uncharacterized protein n=1 Tax=Elysia crispata TaxID=231223 RepID=A0AAE1AF58_9GAST|nr:hypothetical protein RRG08_039149 [Elysia crispata]
MSSAKTGAQEASAFTGLVDSDSVTADKAFEGKERESALVVKYCCHTFANSRMDARRLLSNNSLWGLLGRAPLFILLGLMAKVIEN